MKPMRSLRSRIIAGMVVLIALVFGIAVLGVTSIRSLDRSVNQELGLLLEGTDLGNGLVSAVSSEVRSAEQYLVRPSDDLRAEMLEEGDSEEVVADTGDSSEDLIRFRVLVEDGDGYRVELDKDSWAVQPGTTGKLDSALYDAMDYNEVTLCDPARNGQEFVEAYVARFDGAFDTAEDYYASITDYVDCGTGESD